MNADAIRLVPRRTHGWRMGFANMLAKENAAWWRTRRWWIQSLVAIFFVDGSMVANHQLGGASIERIASFNTLWVFAWVLPIFAITLGQDSILGELHSGTAAWVLSKPLRRPAFLLGEAGCQWAGPAGYRGVHPGCHRLLLLRSWSLG